MGNKAGHPRHGYDVAGQAEPPNRKTMKSSLWALFEASRHLATPASTCSRTLGRLAGALTHAAPDVIAPKITKVARIIRILEIDR